MHVVVWQWCQPDNNQTVGFCFLIVNHWLMCSSTWHNLFPSHQLQPKRVDKTHSECKAALAAVWGWTNNEGRMQRGAHQACALETLSLVTWVGIRFNCARPHFWNVIGHFAGKNLFYSRFFHNVSWWEKVLLGPCESQDVVITRFRCQTGFKAWCSSAGLWLYHMRCWNYQKKYFSDVGKFT